VKCGLLPIQKFAVSQLYFTWKNCPSVPSVQSPRPRDKEMSQAMPPDFLMRAVLALLPYFLPQRQWESLKSREAQIRVKSLEIAEQTINCWVGTLEGLQRDASARQAWIWALSGGGGVRSRATTLQLRQCFRKSGAICWSAFGASQ
jgi:hypothetical protein